MLYYKIIDDRTVFSDCRTILTNDNLWVSNPTAEQIAEAGWLPYVPPVIPPEPETEPDNDSVLQAVKKMLQSSVEELTDEEALEVAALYPTWASKIGEQVNVGERLWYNEALYKVLQQHTAQETWTPDVTASLYAEVSIEEIPEWVQPLSAETAYHLGDKVKHNGLTWESDVDNNVWEPGAVGTEALWHEI